MRELVTKSVAFEKLRTESLFRDCRSNPSRELRLAMTRLDRRTSTFSFAIIRHASPAYAGRQLPIKQPIQSEQGCVQRPAMPSNQTACSCNPESRGRHFPLFAMIGKHVVLAGSKHRQAIRRTSC